MTADDQPLQVQAPPAGLHHAAFATFLLLAATTAIRDGFGLAPGHEAGFLAPTLWIAAATTTLLGLARRLPTQNVAAAASLLFVAGTILLWIAASTAFPFGPIVFTEVLGPRLGDTLPPTAPLVWIPILINARGIARLILKPWRKTTYYGFWVLGLAAILCGAFDIAFEPFATQTSHYWFWHPTRLPITWYSTPLVHFPGRIAAAAGLLACALPWLINKHPVKQAPDLHPLAVWTTLHALFLSSHVVGGRWLAAATTATLTLVTAISAVRGARWSSGQTSGD